MPRENHQLNGLVKTHDNEEEHAKVDELRASLGLLSGCAQKFCSDECLRRYLRARNWNVLKAKRMLKETLQWRASFKPEEIRWTDVEKESETGKLYRADFVDKKGRTVLVLVPGMQNTTSHEGQMRQLVYQIENAIINLPPDEEQMVWLIDFKGWSFTNAVPIRSARETTNILQNHYPERLAFAILFNPPRIFEAFWKIVRHFLDPVTYQKVKFVYSTNPESLKFINENFDIDMLGSAFGGKNLTPYNHSEKSKQMLQDDVKTAAYWQLDDQARETSGTTAISEISGPEDST